MNSFFKKFAFIAASVSVLALTGCPEDVETPCTEDIDCEGDDLCHPTLDVCVANCAIEGVDVCGADAPSCNDGDPRPVDDADFNSICVCVDNEDCGGNVCDETSRQCGDAQGCEVDADCGEGETCNADGGNQGEGVCAAGCAVDADCEDGETCNVDEGACEVIDDGSCLADVDCLSGNELCDLALDVPFCAEPEDVTGGCASAAEFGARDANGPVIYNLELEVDENDTCAGQTAWNISFDYFDADGDAFAEADTGTGPANAAVEWFRETLGAPTFLSDTPVYNDVDGLDAGKDGFVLGVVCFDNAPDNIAVQLADSAGNVSNAACFSE